MIIKSLVVGTIALGTIGTMAPAATAHSIDTRVAYKISAYEDGSARIARTVTHGRKITSVTTWKALEGMVPTDGTSVTLALAPKGVVRRTLAVDVRTSPTVKVTAARVATDEDVEGEVLR